MKRDPIMQEIYRVKYELGEKFPDVKSLAQAARRFSREHPVSATPVHRKLLEDHPIGRSVTREDEILTELRKVKEQLSVELLPVERSVKHPRNKSKTAKKRPLPKFRATKTKNAK